MADALAVVDGDACVRIDVELERRATATPRAVFDAPYVAAKGPDGGPQQFFEFALFVGHRYVTCEFPRERLDVCKPLIQKMGVTPIPKQLRTAQRRSARLPFPAALAPRSGQRQSRQTEASPQT